MSRFSRQASVVGGAAALVLAMLVAPAVTGASVAAAATPCTAPVVNKVACENTLPGNPESEWDVNGNGDPTIQGFATQISTNVGGTVNFKIDTTAKAYRIDIYRIGYYGGNGARKVASVTPTATLPQSQPSCLHGRSYVSRRLRQLGGVSVVGRAGDSGVRRLYRSPGANRHGW